MKSLPISIVIPTFNRYNSLKSTLDSFLSGDVVPDEIIIVDQSNDGITRELIQKYINTINNECCLIKYIEQAEPSLTAARNIGFKSTRNNLVIMSDDDVEIHTNTIFNVVSIMNDESISLIAGLNELENKQKSLAGYFFGFKSFFKRKIGHIAPGIFGRFPFEIKEQTPTMWAMGFFFVIRKPLVEKWNLQWDEKLKSYGYPEDLDFTYLYYKKSMSDRYKCILSSKVVVKHLNSQEYRTPSRQSTFMYVLHRAYLYKKHHLNYFYWIMFNVSNYAMLLMRKIKKESPQDLKDAIKYLRKNKKEVFEGKFYYGN